MTVLNVSENEPFPSFLVTRFVTDPTPPPLSVRSHLKTYTSHTLTQSDVLAMKLTLWRQFPGLTKGSVIQVRFSVPLWTENLSHRCQGQKVAVCIPVLLPAPFLLPLFHHPPLCPETNISDTLPCAAYTPDLIHQAC